MIFKYSENSHLREKLREFRDGSVQHSDVLFLRELLHCVEFGIIPFSLKGEGDYLKTSVFFSISDSSSGQVCCYLAIMGESPGSWTQEDLEETVYCTFLASPLATVEAFTDELWER